MLETIVALYLAAGSGYVANGIVGDNVTVAANPCAVERVAVVGASGNVLYYTCKN